ncbi:MAG: hypothetical protein O2856_07815 [Planctomycetota bacterium]|nr:hypothetical protein [Planctomycetota bacterium]
MSAPDGKVLISSIGPLGNIGYPGSVVGIRHFEKMLKTVQKMMTEEEVAELIESLHNRSAH